MFQIIGLALLGLIQSALVFVSSYYVGDFVSWMLYGGNTPYVSFNQNGISATPTPQTPVSQGGPSVPSSEKGFTVSFITAPSTLKAGQTATIQWSVQGPAGRQGSNALIVTSVQGGSDSFDPSTTTQRQSYGRFTVPTTFTKTVTASSPGSTINLEVTALIEGTVLGARHTIQVIP